MLFNAECQSLNLRSLTKWNVSAHGNRPYAAISFKPAFLFHVNQMLRSLQLCSESVILVSPEILVISCYKSHFALLSWLV